MAGELAWGRDSAITQRPRPVVRGAPCALSIWICPDELFVRNATGAIDSYTNHYNIFELFSFYPNTPSPTTHGRQERLKMRDGYGVIFKHDHYALRLVV